MRSASIFKGRLTHRRRHPSHAFTREMMMAVVDLDTVERATDDSIRLSRILPLSIRESDHLGSGSGPFTHRVRQSVREQTGRSPSGRMLLLTQPRAFGLTFNPVSFVFCLAPDREEEIEFVLAEVTNTPWGERHVYVLEEGECSDSGFTRFRAPKVFHVSPFFGMDFEYEFGFKVDPDRVGVQIVNRRGDEVAFDVSMSLERLGPAEAAKHFAWGRHAFMPYETVLGIYGQALRLAWKGATFHPHPRKVASGADDASPSMEYRR